MTLPLRGNVFVSGTTALRSSTVGTCRVIMCQAQQRLWQDLSVLSASDPEPFGVINQIRDATALNCSAVPSSDIYVCNKLEYLFIKVDDLHQSEIINGLNRAQGFITDGQVTSLGLLSERAFKNGSGQSFLPSLFQVLREERLDTLCTAIRAPFNLFEPDLLQNGSIEFAKANGLLVFGERALMMRSRTDTNSKSYTLLRSTSSHGDLDLARPLKLALNNVIHLEKRAEAAGACLPWGRRIASNHSQLMNLYAWKRALESKIEPGIEICLEQLRSQPDHKFWADHYEESFRTLIERMTLAVEHAAHHENEAVMSVLHDIGGYDPALSIEQAVTSVLQQAGADVLFSPGESLTIDGELPARKREVEKIFNHISSNLFYFEKAARLLPSAKVAA